MGTATVGSGAGSHPLFLTGQVFLTGPYNGGAYGLATVVPAIAGPYNLGTVVVRQSLDINPNDAHVTAVSDPFPTILNGVPLRIKTVNLDLNTPNFIINPTSCQPFQITAYDRRRSAARPRRCRRRSRSGRARRFRSTRSLGIKLTGKGQTKTGKHPTLTATLTAPSSGQANLKTAEVTLPLSLALDPRNTEMVCSVQAAAAIACPSNTIVGTSSAVSPLLPDPLSGNVYIVQGIRTNAQGQQIKTLPSLLIPLKGDIALNLRAQTSVDSVGSAGDDVPGDSRRGGVELQADDQRRLARDPRGHRRPEHLQVEAVRDAVLGSQSGKTETSKMKLSTPACGASSTASSTTKKHHKRHGKRR